MTTLKFEFASAEMKHNTTFCKTRETSKCLWKSVTVFWFEKSNTCFLSNDQQGATPLACSADHWAQWTISWWVYGLNRCFSNWLNQTFKFILEVKVLLRVKKKDETGAILISLILSWVNVKVTCRSGSNLLSFWWPTGGDSCGCIDVDEKKNWSPLSHTSWANQHAVLQSDARFACHFRLKKISVATTIALGSKLYNETWTNGWCDGSHAHLSYYLD